MTVYKIDSTHVKIILTELEVNLGFGGIEKLLLMRKKTKEKLKSLIFNTVNLPEKNIKINGKIAILKDKGCVLRVQFLSKKDFFIYCFENSESLINTVVSVFKEYKHQKSDLYLLDNGYRLITYKKLPELEPLQRQIDFEYTNEYGKPLIKNNAIYQFGKAFIKGS